MTNFDENLDLKIEVLLNAPAEKIWKAWTTPELLKPWFCPAPWTVTDCQIDLRPGGRFDVVMQSPEGHQFPNRGCLLELVPNQRLIWTNTMSEGFRPFPAENFANGFMFTGVIELESQGSKTLYNAYGKHSDVASKQKHEAMGFVEGWTAVAAQLERFVNSI